MEITFRDINERFRQIKAKLNNVGPVLPSVAEVLDASFQRNFQVGGRWDGVGTGFFAGGSRKWDPLADSTKRRYKGIGYSDERTLRRTGGGLAATIETRVQGDSSISISANKAYAAAQQFGDERERVIPVTKAMRKYFWAMFYETEDDKYKYMAMTKKTEFTPRVKIPASPYLVIQQEDVEDIRQMLSDYYSRP